MVEIRMDEKARGSYWRKVYKSERTHSKEALAILSEMGEFTLRTGGEAIENLFFDHCAAAGAILRLAKKGRIEVVAAAGLAHVYRVKTK